ncbi:MAG: GGDEF domain-containing protein [Gammaproteobacteria bacterium]|jgi:GGDEF domain-containing protein
MSALKHIRIGLSDKISITVVAVGVLGLILVYYTSTYYRDIAYDHYQRSLQNLATLKIEEIVEDLKTDAADLARAVEQEPEFYRYLTGNQQRELAALLDNQFRQYFVTAGIIDLIALYVLDVNFDLISESSEGIETPHPAQIICPQLAQSAAQRVGAERLQLITSTCDHRQRPMFALISPAGGLKLIGYVQVVADLASSLQQLEAALGMPIKIQLQNGEVSYQSEEWMQMISDGNRLPVVYKLGTSNNEDSVRIFFLADMTGFNQRVLSHRNWVMALATITLSLTVILILYLLQSSTITPLSRIHRILHLLNQKDIDREGDNRVLFAQLLDNIITLQKNWKQRFAVMILDLDNFEAVNKQYGHEAGNGLLDQVGERLSTILRGTDIISWTGTDTPGHKLLPADAKTEYRATLARLGGDEFGMLLPSVETGQQAAAVAKRIVNSLNAEYTINDQQVTLRCSIGISMYPDHGQQEQELVRNADKAMYQAKQSTEKYCIYRTKKL